MVQENAKYIFKQLGMKPEKGHISHLQASTTDPITCDWPYILQTVTDRFRSPNLRSWLMTSLFETLHPCDTIVPKPVSSDHLTSRDDWDASLPTEFDSNEKLWDFMAFNLMICVITYRCVQKTYLMFNYYCNARIYEFLNTLLIPFYLTNLYPTALHLHPMHLFLHQLIANPLQLYTITLHCDQCVCSTDGWWLLLPLPLFMMSYSTINQLWSP